MKGSWFGDCQWIGIILILSTMTQPIQSQSLKLENFIDYESLSHEITLEIFRAGNHDASGENEYFFKVEAHALVVTKDDRGKDFKDRQKLSREIGTFGNTKIKSLSFRKDLEDNPISLTVDGSFLRTLVADTMQSFRVPETQIALLVKIHLIEKNKKYMVIDDDLLVGETQYFIIPETARRSPVTADQTLEITDQTGTFVRMKVFYELSRQATARR